jgi:DNA-directed RNA polymerase specialized sigma24 family protein
MNHKRAPAELPEAYAAALRLRRAGVPAPQIAAELGLEPEAVAPLLRLAEAKLATLAERCASDERAAPKPRPGRAEKGA